MSCPLCGGSSEAAFTTSDRNRALSRERFEYRRCVACGTYFLANVPADLSAYYPPDYYGFPEAHELDHAAALEAPKLALVARYATGGRLVEIGPGTGSFSRAARNAGFHVTAIEMDAGCCEYLERVAGVQAIQSDEPHRALADLEPAEAIAMWHVVEHVPHPWKLMDAAANRLAPGGVLAIAMPNPESLQFRLLRGRWAHVDAPRHLFLIPYATLQARAHSAGLRAALVTTGDPAGRAWNRFGWEYALRRFPGRRPATRRIRLLAALIARALGPFEKGGLNGATYTALFVKEP
ncbi:MAG TPA: class I SAM-dependent methyltransferase [Solirubrobacteraceae bacterium]|nr:class I SAM-dependent methyltransferase [Solirubrobacteraceae bacterium]